MRAIFRPRIIQHHADAGSCSSGAPVLFHTSPSTDRPPIVVSLKWIFTALTGNGVGVGRERGGECGVNLSRAGLLALWKLEQARA